MVKTTKPKAIKPKKGAKKKGVAAPATFTGPLTLQPGQRVADEQVYQYVAERNDTYREFYNLMSYQGDVLHAESVTCKNQLRFITGVKNVAAREASFHPNLSRTLTNVCAMLDQAESIRTEAIKRIPRSTGEYYTMAEESRMRVGAMNEERAQKYRAFLQASAYEKQAVTAGSADVNVATDRKRSTESDYDEADKTFRAKFWKDQMEKRNRIKLALQQEVYTRMFYHAKALELMTEAYKFLDEIPTTLDSADMKEIMDNLNLTTDGTMNARGHVSQMPAPQQAAAAAAGIATGTAGNAPHQAPKPVGGSEYATGLADRW